MSTVRGISFEDFDPNNLSAEYTLWAVWTGSHFKTYATRAAALNCFASWYKAVLYEYDAGTGWIRRGVKDVNSASDTCDQCGSPALRDSYGSWDNIGSSFQWRRRNGKITSPPELLHVCAPCRQSVRSG